MEVIAIGESMVSLVNNPAGYIRHADAFQPFVAGAETNTLIGLSRLGHKTSWISALGNDELGELILHKVRAEGIDTSNVLRKDDKTGIFFKQVFPDGSVDVTYYRENSAASQMTIDDINIGAVNNAKILYLTGITLSLNESIRDMVFEIVQKCKDEITVVFDPNIRLKMWSEQEARETILNFLPHVDCLIAGKKEVNVLLGTDDYENALHTFMNYGCSKVILKLGVDGAIYNFEGITGKVANPRQFKEVDPVGAGDAFAAGVVSGLIRDELPESVLRKACFLGGYITQFIGDYQGFPNEDMIRKHFIKNDDEKVNR